MSTTQNIRANYRALVESGNIRYECLPAADVPCATGAWAQLLAAAATPAVPWWICGFKVSCATGLVVEQGWRVSLGYGGADGAAIAATTTIVTGWPFYLIGAAAAAMGSLETAMLPYPVQIPIDIVDPGSRVAYTVVNNPTGGAAVGLTSCRIIIAYAVGT
jgi:hypothetical protein